MRVIIEPVIHTYIDFICELPIIGKIKIEWQDANSRAFRIVNKETGLGIKEGFTSFESAENWVLEQNYTLVTE